MLLFSSPLNPKEKSKTKRNILKKLSFLIIGNCSLPQKSPLDYRDDKKIRGGSLCQMYLWCIRLWENEPEGGHEGVSGWKNGLKGG